MKLIDKMLPAGRGVAVARTLARRGLTRRRCATALLLAGISGSAFSAPQGLLKPAQLIVDSGLPPATRVANEYVARQYATFWNTGDDALARAALAENFIDKTPPEGRRQGPEGAILASRAFRQAVPDLRCDVEQMIVAGDRVVSHLHFHGHFTGTFGTRQGKGQNIDFIATDIYQISGGKIAANWHIEDNLTLMKQLGAQ
ncbi:MULTISPECIES: ester cyclase [Klebsiella]|uniref:Predicted ester cyclase n=1 Tax=Klebsiella pneumoniae TaxID=573 RepID=A0A486CZE1_KLEPN|nr:ester cyclase [Klebsiella quasipneumoniae]VGL88046.1 Predicted ester cyclase [Klebsiella pneumoniae]MCJ4906297.1 ester cyclase [Klebsiella quasipneumoniae]MDA5091416.1 ester cyclase [Klebsiella quasipneumoniae subsp. quasipneumoniae]MDZ0891833.1 ester cyclase [Klebsiella quasipneumoniae]UDC58630.1 ester cyclase [Klebsiella quasipneumoniae subsp. quasipneumoniae]